MVSINYTRLFNLRMNHDFYGEQPVPGLTLTPTRQTMRLLKGANMLFKTVSDGIVVLYRAEADEVTPLVNLPPGQRFTFILRAESPAEFQTITQLDVSSTDRFTSSSILYFTNVPANSSGDATAPEKLDHSLIDAVQNSLFNYTFQLNPSPNDVLLRITGPDGNTIAAGRTVESQSLPDPLPIAKSTDDMHRHQIDLRQQPPGKYTFTIRNNADDTTLKEETFYVDDELASKNFLGIAEIVYSDSPDHLYSETEEYELTFTSQETVWTYFIVNQNGNVVFSDHDLVIDDRGPSAVSFNLDGDKPHADIKVNGFETVVFKSGAPIPFNILPKSEVRLIKNPGNSVLLNSLPNPSYTGIVKEKNGQLESEIYVFI